MKTDTKLARDASNACFGDVESTLNLVLVCTGVRPGARLEIMFEALIARARRRGNTVDETLVAFMDRIGRAETAPTKSDRRDMMHVLKLLAEEHAGSILAGLRRVCEPHGVTVVPNGLEPYVLRMERQPHGEETLCRLMCDSSYDEGSQERYALLARVLGYPRHDLHVPAERRVRLVADVSVGRESKSVVLFSFVVQDTKKARDAARRLENDTLRRAEEVLKGLKIYAADEGRKVEVVAVRSDRG